MRLPAIQRFWVNSPYLHASKEQAVGAFGTREDVAREVICAADYDATVVRLQEVVNDLARVIVNAAALREALQDLFDAQNDALLERDRKHWEVAMAKVSCILSQPHHGQAFFDRLAKKDIEITELKAALRGCLREMDKVVKSVYGEGHADPLAVEWVQTVRIARALVKP